MLTKKLCSFIFMFLFCPTCQIKAYILDKYVPAYINKSKHESIFFWRTPFLEPTNHSSLTLAAPCNEVSPARRYIACLPPLLAHSLASFQVIQV